MTEAEMVDLLHRAEQALWALSKAALAVKPTLSKPYSDAPETTPWQQFVREPARQAYDLKNEIHRALQDT